jgi:uncharacterized protein YigE (DUF2233 family)
VGPGVDHVSFSSKEPAFAGHAFVVDLEKVELRIVPARGRQTVDAIAGAPVHLALNASFFDQANNAMGRVVDDGKVLVAERRTAWGALIVENRHARVVLGDQLPAREAGGDLVVQGVPRLVVQGEVPKLKPAAAARTAVCAEGTKLVFVVATDPVDTTDFARFLARPRDKGGVGCSDALNLDGGPSTQLHARLPGLTLDVRGGWGVPNALVVTPRVPGS